MIRLLSVSPHRLLGPAALGEPPGENVSLRLSSSSAKFKVLQDVRPGQLAGDRPGQRSHFHHRHPGPRVAVRQEQHLQRHLHGVG